MAKCKKCGHEWLKRTDKPISCPKCKSYDCESYPFHTEQEVLALKQKLTTIKTEGEKGNHMFINKESRLG